MSQNERVYRIHQLLQDRGVVPTKVFLDELEVSLATFKRDLEYMRDRLNAPIEADRDAGGYRYTREHIHAGPRFELPGVWFNAAEVYSLLTMQELLKQLEPGLLGERIAPLLTRLQGMLDSKDTPTQDIASRIRILRIAGRLHEPAHFGQVAIGTLQRRQLRITYFVRERNERTDRTVSPQRLVHYRDNWYLDAWCHERNALRSFSLDAIERVKLLDDIAVDIDAATLDATLTGGYGIFAGSQLQWATLRFSPERARYISREVWHKDQQSEWQADGHYILKIPYSDEREFLMEILRHGAEVEVLEPIGLRTHAIGQLQSALRRYQPWATASSPGSTSAPAILGSALQKEAARAADLIRHADGLLITAGAGMGVDSGLPDFRGDHGLWQAYPALASAKMPFADIASPQTFRDDSRLAWGFYGHRLGLYRETQPHAGFELLRRWASKLKQGAFVYTSNVDGQFQKAGFEEQRILECHGSIHYMQCLAHCRDEIWSAEEFHPLVDEAICRLQSPLPRCPHCGALARPNVRMFGDWDWVEQRATIQQAAFAEWLKKTDRPVIVELGAGTAIATIRRLSERVGAEHDAALIRINPTEAAVPRTGDVGLPLGALAGLTAIGAALGRW